MLWLPLLLAATFFSVSSLDILGFIKGERHGCTKGYRPLFDPYSFPGNALPTTWWNIGFRWTWLYRRTAHFEHSYDLTTIIPVFGNPYYVGASADIAKQVWGNELKTNLAKPQDFTTERIFGGSIASAHGTDWRRHRRAVAPSFNTAMYSTVIKESGVVYRDMDTPQIHVSYDLSFGMPVEWTRGNDHSELTTFDREFSVAARTIIYRLILPDWVWKLPIQSLRAIMKSWKNVLSLMTSIAARRKAEFSAEKDFSDGNIPDLLTKLVTATDGTNKYALGPVEVTANMMSLLFAGNEVSLHPDEQEKAYQEILREAPSKEGLSFGIVSDLKHLFACFNEAHRLVPVTINLPRVTTEDTPIHTSRPVERDHILPKGSRVVIDIVFVCKFSCVNLNTKIPSRWYDVAEHDFLMFGFGPRACVCRKFAQTEAVCFLAHFLRDWKTEVVLEAGETAAQAWDRIASGATLRGTAFSLGSVPFKLVARDSESS
ncbi:cytochrome P450 [Desarmillaria tabescens]|uniref:Cytochrome P450 n=1 Tax=Armillaria tabescens TaxID=1929756 RepID=A0AA39KAU5_ARMTA|nr:cytochrome P450 [Desarmillaria tabescens]KAK0457448.1 cytochrome P450 [Desarmillaria tabescens]